MKTGRLHQKQAGRTSGAVEETRIGREAGVAATGRTTFARFTGGRPTTDAGAAREAKTESNQSQPVSARAVAEKQLVDTQTARSAAGLTIRPNAIMIDSCFVPPPSRKSCIQGYWRCAYTKGNRKSSKTAFHD